MVSDHDGDFGFFSFFFCNSFCFYFIVARTRIETTKSSYPSTWCGRGQTVMLEWNKTREREREREKRWFSSRRAMMYSPFPCMLMNSSVILYTQTHQQAHVRSYSTWGKSGFLSPCASARPTNGKREKRRRKREIKKQYLKQNKKNNNNQIKGWKYFRWCETSNSRDWSSRTLP